MKKLKIKNLTLKNPLLLAPMLDVTNLPYRILCKKAGASLCFTEMLYVEQILHKNKKTLNAMKTSKEDRPIGIQITGNNIKEFEKVIPYLKKYNLVDLNCGCPSIRIIGTKAGAYLLKEPEKIVKIIKILKKTKKPVTVKIRLGFNKNNAVKIAKTIEKAGADAITVHARLQPDSYSKPADWNEIKKIKNSVKIPIIANGDIFSGKDAETLLKFADGVMIGRGAIGNPLLFRQILDYLKTRKEIKIGFEKKIEQFKEYLKLSEKYNLIELQKIKFVGSHFLRGFKGASEKRNHLMQLKTFKEIKKFVNSLLISS